MAKKLKRNELRVIGGEWRGRRFRFPPLAALRPSPDRVRETLFNWLQPVIAGSRCLDLFAGSGALGLEALSRGAGRVVFIEREDTVVKQLRDTLQTLGAAGAAVHRQDARRFLAGAPEEFDIVFLDPPYGADWLPEICRALEANGWLASPALIYLETPARTGPPGLPEGWKLLKSKRAGEVGYHLARREGASGAK
jgi:16S rRNA (guanine966-N2)-methyltransferase